MLKKSFWYAIWIMTIGMLGIVACTQAPPAQPGNGTATAQIVTVEVTRVIAEPVEVTRVVTERVQVTRVVKVTRVVMEVATPTPTPIKPTPVISAEQGIWSGTYSWYAANDRGCVLEVTHWKTLEPFQPADFHLSCCRGGPSYNTGEMSGRMLISEGMGAYSYVDEVSPREGPCYLVFQFEGDTVEVTQLGMDFHCGFGFGVYAFGVYTRTN